MNKVSVVLTGAVVILTIASGMAVYERVADGELHDGPERYEAFCYQMYGSPDVINAAVVGGHGGYHCTANEHGPHLHAYPEEAITDALVANRTNKTFDPTDYETKSPGWLPLTDVQTPVVLIGFVAFILFAIRHGPRL